MVIHMSGAFQLDFAYGVDSQDAKVICMNGGSSACANGLLSVACGPSQWSGAGMQGRFPLAVVGDKLEVTFTAMFDANPAPGTMQIVGVGDGEHGIFVGYNEDAFGVRLLLGGKMQFYLLTVPIAASKNGQLTLSINGVSFVYNLSQGQSITSILSQVATDVRLTAANLTTCIVNNGLYIATALAFPSIAPMSLTDSGTGTQSVLTQIIAGVAPQDQWVYSNNWNGPGLSRPTNINFSAGNTFRVRLTPLGFGTVTVSVLDPASMAFTDLHTFTNANAFASLAFLGTGLVPSMYSCNYTGNTILKVQSTGFIVSAGPGNVVPARIRPPFSAYSNYIGLTIQNTATTLLNLQNMPVFSGLRNSKVINLNTLSINVTATQPCQVCCWKDAVLAGPLAGVPSDNNSIVLVDNTTRTAVTSGTLLHNWLVPASLTLSGLDMSDCWAEPGSSLTFSVSSFGQTTSVAGVLTATSNTVVTATVGLCATWCQT